MEENRSDTVDAIAMKRRIQEQIYAETRDMTPVELLAYFRKRIANSQFADFLTSTETSQPDSDTSKRAFGNDPPIIE